MSFIRFGQHSDYVDLHDGSKEYIYDHGNGVEGFGSYGEFIDALCLHAEYAGLSDATISSLERALEDHYGEHRLDEPEGDFKAIGPKPEMAHVLAQHLDARLEEMTYPVHVAEKLREYAETAFDECPRCGDTYRKNALGSGDDVCQECYVERLRERDVSTDVSELREYVEDDLPSRVPPEDFHDDEFYRLVIETYTSVGGEDGSAIHHILGEAADEIHDAVVEERAVDTEYIHDILDEVDDGE